MKSSQNTVWVAGAGVLAVLLVVLTYLFVVAPKRTEATDLATQRVSVQENNAAIQQKTAQLASEFETLPEKRVELAAITSTLPSEAEVPDLLRGLENFATSAGVTVTQIAPGAPAAFEATASPGAASATTAATGIVQIPLTLTVSGSFPQIELYLKNLQVDLPRHVLVQGVTLNSVVGGTASGVTATITGSIFVIPSDATAAAPATTSSNAASATGPATATTTTTTTTTTGMVS